MTITVIINGYPGVGKDTFVNLCATIAPNRVGSYSSIDPVRSLLKDGAGIDVSAKTEADRRLLAVVGSALEDHSNWRTEKCIQEAIRNHLDPVQGMDVLFLHIREPENIIKVVDQLSEKCPDMITTTLFLTGDRGKRITSNSADANVEDMVYVYRIDNSGTLNQLADKARAFLSGLGVI